MPDFWSWIKEDLFTDSTFDPSKIQRANNSNQFVFVDGRAGNHAKRIRIDHNQVIRSGNIGNESPYIPPVLINFSVDEESRIGTLEGQGCVVGYVIVEVNSFYEKSQPTPMFIMDGYQWQRKGERSADDEYVYGTELKGSIKNVTLGHTIIGSDVVELEVYRCVGYSSGSRRPMSSLLLTKTVPVPEGATYVEIVDSNPFSSVSVEYDKQIASPADNIALSGATVFLGNAVNVPITPVSIDKTWTINLINSNDYNYVNCWWMIDLYDDVICPSGEPKLEGFNWDSFEPAKTRILDSEFVTPLRVFMYPIDSTLYNFALNGVVHETIKTRRFMFIRIPYFQAGQTKQLYFTLFDSELPTSPQYPNEFVEIDNSSVEINDFIDEIVSNPIRDEETIFAMANREITSPMGLTGKTMSFYFYENKANINVGGGLPATSNDDDIILYDELQYYLSGETPASMRNTWFDGSMNFMWNKKVPMPRKGFAYFWLNLDLSVNEGDDRIIFHINENETTESNCYGNPSVGVMMKGIDESGTYYLYFRAYASKTSTLDTGTEYSDIRFNLGASPSGYAQFFILLSWENIMSAIGVADSTMNLYLCVIALNSYNDAVWESADIKSSEVEGTTGGFEITGYNGNNYFGITSDMNNGFMSHPFVSGKEYLNDYKHALQLSRFFPLTPTDPVGCCYDYVLIDTDKYNVNRNVVIERLYRNDDKSVGRIMWSKYGQMSALNEINSHKEVLGLVPMKSFMPTIERETVLVYFEDGVKTLTLVGSSSEECSLVDSRQNIGLINRDAITIIPDGLFWLDKDGACLITASGVFEPVGSQNILIESHYKVVYDPENKLVWIVDDNYNAFIYNILFKNFSSYLYASGTHVPSTFFYHKNLGTLEIDYCFPSEEDYSLYTRTGAPLDTKIKTRAYHIGRRNKIIRTMIKSLLTLPSLSFTYLANIWGFLIGGSGEASSAEYTSHYNRQHSIPHLRGEYVQFEIDNADEVTGIELEINNVSRS